MKRVIKNVFDDNTVLINETVVEKIYAFKDTDGEIFKLHEVDDTWVFVSLHNTDIVWDTWDNMDDALDDTVSEFEVFEFEDINEFLRWGLE